MTWIIDTNVLLIANRQHPDVGEGCVAACARLLHEIQAGGRVAIDDAYQVLKEYQNKSTPHVGRRAGDAFIKWLLRNNANPERCDRVELRKHPERGFERFPEDPRLDDFDPPDRIFVALARAHPARPPIAQAADSKWLGWAPALNDHGVSVAFLCLDDVKRFEENKRKESSE